MFRLIILFYTLIFSVLCSAVANAELPRPTIATSLACQGYFIKKLVNDFADVQVLMPPTGNPHTFEPSVKQVKIVSKALAYIKIGHPDLTFESVLVKKVAESNKKIRIVNASQGISLETDDPHIWTSPKSTIIMARNIASKLKEVFPDKVAQIALKEAETYNEILQIDKELSEIFRNIPNKTFFVFHPAWGYFARDYGLVQIAVEEHGKEPSVAHTSEVIRKARERGAKTLFIQVQTSRPSAQAVANDMGVNLEVLDVMLSDWPKDIRSMAQKIKQAM